MGPASAHSGRVCSFVSRPSETVRARGHGSGFGALHPSVSLFACVSMCLFVYVYRYLPSMHARAHASPRPAAPHPPALRVVPHTHAHTQGCTHTHAHARAHWRLWRIVAQPYAQTQRHRNTETERERERVSLVLPCCFCIDIMLTVNQKTHAQRGKLPHMITATKPNTRDTCVTSIFGNTVYSSC